MKRTYIMQKQESIDLTPITPTELTDSVGTVVQSYTYSSFGKIESQLDPGFVQPYTFTAREFDAETGLHFYRGRYYEAHIGRFLSEDRLNIATVQLPADLLPESLVQTIQSITRPTAGGGSSAIPAILSGGTAAFHPYVYVVNNPIIYKDPHGWLRFCVIKCKFKRAAVFFSCAVRASARRRGGPNDVPGGCSTRACRETMKDEVNISCPRDADRTEKLCLERECSKSCPAR